MDYKIKKKIVKGNVRYGLILENLEPATEFEYLSITKEGPYYFMKREDGGFDVFTLGKVVKTDYTSLEIIPFGPNSLCVGRSSTKLDLVSFGKSDRSGKVRCIVGNDLILGSTKIDDIVIGPEFAELYQKVDGGVLKGYLYHPIFGTLMPEFIEMEAYKYKAEKPFYPKGYSLDISGSYGSQECVYAIVTALVNGEHKNGIITRTRKYLWDDYFKYVWQEVEPCVHDDIERIDDSNFRLIDYVDGKRKESLLRTCTFYELSSQGRLVFGYPHLQKDYVLPLADAYEKILTHEAEPFCWWKKDIYFYQATDKGTKGLYRVSLSPSVHSSYDSLRDIRIGDTVVYTLLDCSYDAIETIYATRELNAFLTKKGEVTELMFDKYDKQGNILKKEVVDAKVIVYSSDHAKTLFEMSLPDGTCEIVQLKSSQLAESKPYRTIKKWIDINSPETCFLFGIEEDGHFDVYSNKFVEVATGVDTFAPCEGFYVSTKKTDEETEYSIYSPYSQNECLHTQKSAENLNFHYNAKEKLLFIRFGKHIVIKNLKGQIVLEGDYINVLIGNKFIICEDESGFVVFKYDQEGNISPFLDAHFVSAELVANETRLIASYKTEEGTSVFGVFETSKGNVCIEFEYDKITWEDERFRCEKDGNVVYLDRDGYILDDPIDDMQKDTSMQMKPVDKE